MRIVGACLFIPVVLGAIYCAGYRLSNPDMTDMRCFINNAGIIAVMFLCGLCGVVILGNTEDDE